MVRAGCGGRGGKWPWSSAPTGGKPAIGCGGGFPLSGQGMAVPAEARRREGRVKQGGNTVAVLSSSLSERVRLG